MTLKFLFLISLLVIIEAGKGCLKLSFIHTFSIILFFLQINHVFGSALIKALYLVKAFSKMEEKVLMLFKLSLLILKIVPCLMQEKVLLQIYKAFTSSMLR